MQMAEDPKAPVMDLEKELRCAICTDVLFQPLTLLDCLHTFCGACLKEWFSLQASTATSAHPYTCPSCRASVRAAQKDARVTTLLEMFLQANPDRGKSEEEKEDQRKIYKPGDVVMPKLRRRQQDPEDDRLMDEIRELSLREVGVSNGAHEEPRDRRQRDRSREHRETDGRRYPRRDTGSPITAGDTHPDYRANSLNTTSNSSPRPTTRQIEHQSSLRSLLSASEFDSEEMEAEIMRQIREEGLLDGIDLENIDRSQEEEISERIAEAFRRRQRDRDRSRQARARSESTHSASHQSRDEHAQRRHRARAESSVTQPTGPSRPPVSRPHLFNAVNEGPRHHRRSSSQGSTRSARNPHSRGLSIDPSRPAARSATDLTDRPQTTTAGVERTRRPIEGDRRITDPERQPRISEVWFGGRPGSGSNNHSPRRAAFGTETTASPSIATPPATADAHASLRQSLDMEISRHTPPTNNSSPSLARPQQVLEAGSSDTRPSSSSATIVPSGSRPVLYPEPSKICDCCGKTQIEYSLHYNCSKCAGGHYDLCIRCYRAGKGCLHWFGFGNAALRNYQNKAPLGGYPPGHEEPHTLIGRRYIRPSHASISPAAPNDRSRVLTTEDPAQRLQSGVFCDMCHAFANGCYWKCDTCSEGAWGFCNSCVNQGRHCTHPLLPLQHNTSSSSFSTTEPPPSISTSITPKSASLNRGPGTTPLANTLFRPLTFSTLCDICAYPIPPSHTRFHCPRCNAGNSDICTSCYHGLVACGRIAPENGHHGWRRCPHGHRMVVVGFEDRAGGQKRVVVRELVGGLRGEEGDEVAVREAAREAVAAAAAPPSWSWRDADGAVRKTRLRAGTGTGTGTVVGMGAGGKLQQQGQQELRIPPDGGVGMRAVALWGYWPGEGVEDELMFPKGAEVGEVEDINGDWFFGCYAGAKGLFPGTYVRQLW